MKRIIVLLLLLMICIPAAAADRIAPTTDIGLFIESNSFKKRLLETPLGSLLRDSEFVSYKSGDHYKFCMQYKFPGSTLITANIADYGKVNNIIINIGADWEKVQNRFTYEDVLSYTLQATGLPFSTADEYSAVKSVSEKNYWNGWLFGITSYIDPYTSSAVFNIVSSYIFNGDDPYSVMKLFEGPCDSNYVGACVPIVNYDLDCSDIGMRNFFVTGTDKHRFDSDGNGVCCEPAP